MERTESNVDRKCNGKNREQISEGCWQEIQNNREQKNRTTENRKRQEIRNNREQKSRTTENRKQNNREQKNRTTENRKTEEKSNQNQEKPTEKWKK